MAMFYRLKYSNRATIASGYNYFFSNVKRGLNFNQNFMSNSSITATSKVRIKFRILLDNMNTPAPKFKQTYNLSSTDIATKRNYSGDQSTRPNFLEDSINPFNVSARERRSEVSRMISPKKKIKQFIKLTKPNLTILVTLSSICSYAISPNSLSVAELAFLTVGTALCSGSANAINMGREPEFDKKMTRTSTRPVVTGVISPTQAFTFAALTGILGTSILYVGVNSTVAILGLINIGLYGWVYTSLKRQSILNTWVGALVGAIPPLMGWAASTSLYHPGGWCLAALLYAWQFPHFNSLSHNIADQYKGAGYIMTAAENPRLNARVALRYSLLMFPICISLSYFGITDWMFPFDSGIANLWLTLLAFRFWKQQRINHSRANPPPLHDLQAANLQAKKLFWCSVWQLPAVLILAMLHKKGQWDRLWIYMNGNGNGNSEPVKDAT